MTAILALDFGSRTGWALRDGNTLSGTWDIIPKRGESPGMRYLRLRARLNEVLQVAPSLALVAYEQAHHRGGAATEYAAGCAATLQAWCTEHRIEHVAVHSATIKKHTCGTGRADKGAVIAAMQKLGFDPQDDNEADALALLMLAKEQYGAAATPAPAVRKDVAEVLG